MNSIDNVPLFLTLDKAQQKASLEALIFASDETLTLKQIFNIMVGYDNIILDDNDGTTDIKKASQTSIEKEVLEKFNFSKEDIEKLISEINQELSETGRPYEIVNFANGYQFATRKEYGEIVQNLLKLKTKKRLSKAALETLAIVAYRQPVSKPEIEQIRGVNSNEVVNSLIEKDFVKMVGRSDALGKPLLYGTTDEFLRQFGLKNLSELPKLRELEELALMEYDNSDKDIITFEIDENLQSQIENNYGLLEISDEEEE
jgi:segregation and condensation protein B